MVMLNIMEVLMLRGCLTAVFWAVIFTASAVEYKTILGGKGKNVEEGFIASNSYCLMGFLNPSKYVGAVSVNDIDVITRQDTAGKFTLEERESKIRLFFKPSLRVTTVARRSRTVRGDGDWTLEKIPGGVKYSRTHADALNNIGLEISAVMDSQKAQVSFDIKLENNGNGDCRVDFSPEFNFLRHDVQPLELTVRRSMALYHNGKRNEFFYNEKTVLNGAYRTYWWRRVNPDNKDFVSHFNRECIPFNHPRLKSPEVFGLTGLAGDATLVWDMGKTVMDKLDVRWEGVLTGVEPIWDIVLKPGEKREMKFRLLTLRGMEQIDAVQDDWVFSYTLEDDLLYIQALPLMPQQRLAMQGALSDSRNNQVLINQRAEMAAMNPFNPGRMEWRAANKFIPGVTYPIKITMSPISDRSVLIESSGRIIHH